MQGRGLLDHRQHFRRAVGTAGDAAVHAQHPHARLAHDAGQQVALRIAQLGVRLDRRCVGARLVAFLRRLALLRFAPGLGLDGHGNLVGRQS